MRRLFLAGLVLAMAWSASAQAQGKADPAGMGPLAPLLLQGRDGDWRGATTAGVYRLESRGGEAGLRYFYTDLGAAAAGRRTARVTVTVESDRPTSYAGLLYGFRPEPRSYFLYALSGDGGAVLLRREGATVRRLWSLRDDATATRHGELMIAEQGGAIQLLLDGRLVGRIEHADMGTGGVGIVAAGRGASSFADFTLAEASSPAPAPPLAADPPAALPPSFGLGALGGGMEQ